MIDNISEFMMLEVDEKAEVITEMVRELAIETGYPIDICVALVAEYKGWSRFQVENYIKKCDQDLLYQVAFYVGEKKVYKYMIDKEVRESVEKRLLPLILEHPFEVSAQFVRKIIQDYYENVDWTQI